MDALAAISAVVAMLAVGVVYGTDVFSAIALRPALLRVDDSALTSVMGNVHRFADRRMRLPGILGLAATAAAAALAAAFGHPFASLSAGAALILLVVWMILYVRISAPINRRLTSAADSGTVPDDARTLQDSWDRIIVLRARLQGLALLALSLSLILD